MGRFDLSITLKALELFAGLEQYTCEQHYLRDDGSGEAILRALNRVLRNGIGYS
jgi:hypothetical protein